MRQVAGKLRLDMAQYNNLAAFAQFGSELDKVSQAQLARGERMVELLKQDQYSPLTVEKQVISLYAGTNGFVDDIPTASIRRFESELLSFIERRQSDLLKTIADKKTIDDALKPKLEAAIKEFKQQFRPS
jgi:F-type H+-transporting ATPase subunit alpha